MTSMKTLFVGNKIISYKSIPSTNLFAQELLQSEMIYEGTIIKADKQTAGRGQRGSTWESSDGKNLTFSVILKPIFLEAKDQFYLSKCIAIAIRNFLKSEFNENVSIKWPNDIYVNNKKICGLLIENVLSGKFIKNSIVGIGLNVNQIEFPSSVGNATSMQLEYGSGYNLNQVLERLCSFIEVAYLNLKKDKYCFDNQYLASLHQFGEFKSYWVENKKLQLKIVGVDVSGRLLTENLGGETMSFDLKEIKFMP